MYIIGLTGSMASGKSTVAKMLAQLGAKIFDADAVCHQMLESNREVVAELVSNFGQEILNTSNNIDRPKLAALVFADAKKLKILENIIHQSVWSEASKFIKHAEHTGETIVVLDVPLLIEVAWHTRVQSVWVVAVPTEVQISRAMLRDGLSKENIVLRLEKQMPLEEKKRFSSVVIDNSKDYQNTKQQVLSAWQQELERVRKKVD